MGAIETAESFYGPKLARVFRSVDATLAAVPASEWASFIRTQSGVPHPRPAGHVFEPVTHAHVNHGRWLVACPFGCGEHQHASETDRRFFCTTCRNHEVGGYSVPVVWPDDDGRAEVERILLARPMKHNQHWRPHETADSLAAENRAHGIAA